MRLVQLEVLIMPKRHQEKRLGAISIEVELKEALQLILGDVTMEATTLTLEEANVITEEM
jgi:hypothetical protein